MRVRPRSSEKKAWLLSPPSTVLLLSKGLMPRKLMRPKPLPSLTAPGVRRAKLDQRPLLIGKLLMAVSLTTFENSCDVVLTIGISALTSTTAPAEATLSFGVSWVTLPVGRG